MLPNILSFFNHMTTKTYQDEIIDPVIRKICNKMDTEQYVYTDNCNNITIKFGATYVSVGEDEDGDVVYLNGVEYSTMNQKSYDALCLSYNRVKSSFAEKKKRRDKITLDLAVKDILEDVAEKPYVQRF